MKSEIAIAVEWGFVLMNRDSGNKNQPFHKRVRFALNGIGETWRRERSFRAQVGVAVLVVIALILLRPPVIWWALIGFIIAVVLAFEVINAALEGLIDHLHPDIHPEIRVIKDMAAGAVLFVVLGAIAVAAVLLISLAWDAWG